MLFRQVWSHNLHQKASFGGTFFSPSLILTTGRTSRLMRLDSETGLPLWEAKIRDSWGWLAANDTLALYLNQHKFLQCFALDTGVPIWERSLVGGNVFGYVVAQRRYLVTGGWRGYTPIHCLDAETGTLLWWYSQEHDFASPVSGPWGLALPYTGNSELTILDWANGHVTRRLSLPADLQVADRATSIQRYNDNLLITTKDGHMYLLNPAMDTLWQRIGIHDDGIATMMPAILGSELVFQDREQSLCCYDIDRGYLKWARRIMPPHVEHYGLRLAATMISGERIVVGTSVGRLEVLNSEGDRIGAHTVGKRVATDLCVVGNDDVIFGTTGLIMRYSIQPGSP